MSRHAGAGVGRVAPGSAARTLGGCQGQPGMPGKGTRAAFRVQDKPDPAGTFTFEQPASLFC